MGRDSLREQLLEFIEGISVDGQLTPDTSLIRSSLFDSLNLFQLFLFVERQTGAPLDPTTFDLAAEWDTVNDIVEFVEARRK